MRRISASLLLVICCGVMLIPFSDAGERKEDAFRAVNKVREEKEQSGGEATAVVGGGCFWCTEAVFERLDGVISVTSGYAGGSVENPTYKEICAGRTGHAEVIRISYKPEKIAYGELLDWFWRAHDPTTLNRQGADVGPQYRSIILYRTEEEKRQAEKSKADAAASGRFKGPIVTEIKPLQKFYPAEDYHQDYFRNNPNAPYCAFVIQPKLKKLEKEQNLPKRK